MLENASSRGLSNYSLDDIFRQIAIGNTPGPNVTMKHELLRFCTLHNFPNRNQYIIRLAGTSFCYAPFCYGDEVVCYCCGLRRKDWDESDVPEEVHRRYSPDCSFFVRNSQVNYPVPKDCDGKPNRFSFLESSIEERHTFGQVVRTQDISPNEVNNPPEVPYGPAAPKHPKYTAAAARRMSFVGWPEESGQSPDALVDAGFFYAGMSDCVRCFFCGIGFRNWQEGDDPWNEHARYSRTCIYLMHCKGEEFIALIHMALQFHDNQQQQPQQPQQQQPGLRGEQEKTDQEEAGACGCDPIGREASAKAWALAGVMAEKKVGTEGNRTQFTQARGAIAESTQIGEEPIEETNRLRKQTLCQICEDRTVCIVFLPCGHLVTCANCAPRLVKCPVCRQRIKGTVKTYLS